MMSSKASTRRAKMTAAAIWRHGHRAPMSGRKQGGEAVAGGKRAQRGSGPGAEIIFASDTCYCLRVPGNGIDNFSI